MDAVEFAVQRDHIRRHQPLTYPAYECVQCISVADDIVTQIDAGRYKDKDSPRIWEALGWFHLKGGEHANAFRCPHGKIVARYSLRHGSYNDKGYAEHVRNCQKYPDNPYFQNIYLHRQRYDPRGYVCHLTVMEYLVDVNWQTYEEIYLLWKKIDGAKFSERNEELEKALEDAGDPYLRQWVEILLETVRESTSTRTYYQHRLSMENFRMRGNQLVIIDPLH